jgi:hypothetical protein
VFAYEHGIVVAGRPRLNRMLPRSCFARDERASPHGCLRRLTLVHSERVASLDGHARVHAKPAGRTAADARAVSSVGVGARRRAGSAAAAGRGPAGAREDGRRCVPRVTAEAEAATRDRLD